MKIKLITVFASMIMLALAFAPFDAYACSGNKTNPSSGNSSQPTTPEGVRQS